jgi:hypothetical protein
VQLLLLDEIKGAEQLAESAAVSRLAESGKCDYRFTRCYWLSCRHMIYVFETLGEIKEPDWKDLSEQFDESGFEIYTSRGLLEINNEIGRLSRDFESKLVTSEALDSIRTRFSK